MQHIRFTNSHTQHNLRWRATVFHTSVTRAMYSVRGFERVGKPTVLSEKSVFKYDIRCDEKYSRRLARHRDPTKRNENISLGMNRRCFLFSHDVLTRVCWFRVRPMKRPKDIRVQHHATVHDVPGKRQTC